MDTAGYVAGSCSTAGISNLGNHTDAVDAMKAFCKKELGPAGKTLLTAFYVFTAGPEDPGHGYSKRWVKYGTEFAAFIKAHKLGTVSTPGNILNKKYHNKTTCQAWVWRPNQEAVTKWWNKNRPPARKRGFV